MCVAVKAELKPCASTVQGGGVGIVGRGTGRTLGVSGAFNHHRPIAPPSIPPAPPSTGLRLILSFPT